MELSISVCPSNKDPETLSALDNSLTGILFLLVNLQSGYNSTTKVFYVR